MRVCAYFVSVLFGEHVEPRCDPPCQNDAKCLKDKFSVEHSSCYCAPGTFGVACEHSKSQPFSNISFRLIVDLY